MIAVICSADGFLSDKLAQICAKAGLRVVRTAKVDRLILELKQPHRVAIVDICLEAVQERGVLRQVVNVGRIVDNSVICICPNQEEDLKKLARAGRPEKVFLRFDLQTRVTEFLEQAALSATEDAPRA